MIRCADAAGADLVIVTAESVDVYNPKAVRASAGSLFHLPVAVGVTAEQAVEALRAAGLRILAADGPGAADLDDELDAGAAGAARHAGCSATRPGVCPKRCWALADEAVPGADPRTGREPQPGDGGSSVPLCLCPGATVGASAAIRSGPPGVRVANGSPPWAGRSVGADDSLADQRKVTREAHSATSGQAGGLLEVTVSGGARGTRSGMQLFAERAGRPSGASTTCPTGSSSPTPTARSESSTRAAVALTGTQPTMPGPAVRRGVTAAHGRGPGLVAAHRSLRRAEHPHRPSRGSAAAPWTLSRTTPRPAPSCSSPRATQRRDGRSTPVTGLVVSLRGTQARAPPRAPSVRSDRDRRARAALPADQRQGLHRDPAAPLGPVHRRPEAADAARPSTPTPTG